MTHAPAMGMIGTQELLIILVILLFIFGGSRLPQLAKGLGKSIREFKQGATGIEDAASLAETPGRQLD
ncbi:MAG TPA: twin-arginine translocase TatA/TatE family subunit [Pyrinomonadaceae bacterium]|nr:twin-arginine translocase TatA/TatE family subunit [Pyrinomonadaceae bacterium]